MKRTLKTSIICAIFFILLTPTLSAQLCSNYAFAGVTPASSRSLIRVYSPTQAVVLYKSPTLGTVVSLIDMSLNVKTVSLLPGYDVYDMEIVNDLLFMCGQHNNAKAFLAWLDINDIANNIPTSITYQDADKATILRRMVAYQAPSGVTKVVAVGENDYAWHSDGSGNIIPEYPPIWEECNSLGYLPSASSIFDLCNPPYTCTLNIVVEFDNPQLYTSGSVLYDFIAINDKFHYERVDDVVETDNYIVFVGEEDPNWDNLVLHRCNKNNVIASFNNYYKFSVPSPEGLTRYLGCHMKEDTVAVVSRGSGMLGSSVSWETRIRVIDAPSMTMTSTQVFDLNDYKTDPTDIIYCEGTQTLVLLQEQLFPSYSGNAPDVFMHLKPYVSGVSSYLAEEMVEYYDPIASPYSFNSLDRISDGEHYVSSGGDYWMMNNTLPVMAAVCRMVDQLNVKVKKNVTEKDLNYIFNSCFVKFDITLDVQPVVTNNFSPFCCY